MAINPVTLDNVKIYYDKDGKASEVLMSYATFRQIEAILDEVTPREQQYVLSESWQARIREGEADIKAGRTRTATSENLDAALEWLDE
jgi:predicted transcriptional regulator